MSTFERSRSPWRRCRTASSRPESSGTRGTAGRTRGSTPTKVSWPEFVPLPQVTAAVAWVRERRQRLRDARLLLRGEADPDSEDDEW